MRWSAGRLAVTTIVAAAITIPIVGCGEAGAAGAKGGRELEPGTALELTLDPARANFAEFFVDVPSNAVSLRFKLVSERVELDLSTSLSEAIDPELENQDFIVTSDAGIASVVYDRFTTPPLRAGRCHARVEWPLADPPRTPKGEPLMLHFKLEASITLSRIDGVLAPETAVRGTIDRASGDFRTYTIEVPPDTRVLRFDLALASSDLDLLVRFGAPMLRREDAVFVAEHAFGRESLVVRAPGVRALEAGTWFVDVVDRFGGELSSAFELRARFDAAPDPTLLAYPAFATRIGDGPLSRALAAVVELSIDDSTGSGVLLTRDGWIVTCAHVVTDIGGAVAQDVVVALTLDPKSSARETFRGRVREIDPVRDLALVKIERGFYGQVLPNDFALPFVEVDFTREPEIGETLVLVGYPSTGGQGQRVSISATRGIVSGFETLGFGVVLKTDAEITTGNSGGAALDQSGRLLGVPASTIENGASQIGYVHPVTLLPETWRRQLAQEK